MAGKFELKPAAGNKYLWNLKAGNGEIILTSETYNSKEAAKNGIESAKTNSGDDARYERKASTKQEPFFVLKAANNETLGRSEMYSSASARENGIESCKKNGATAPVVDLT
jgi:uncharacterized protein YegP (UPF0339 family)